MIVSKHFVFIAAFTATILLVIGNWVTPAKANNIKAIVATPTPMDTPIAPLNIPGEVPSVEQQEGIKSVIQSYFELRYQALSALHQNSFQLDGFNNLVSGEEDAKAFLDVELGKLAVDIKYAELNHLRYVDYKYFLTFQNILVDITNQTSIVSVIEENEVIEEISQENNADNPTPSHMYNLEHMITLRHEQGVWKIVSDEYTDYLWRTLRETEETSAVMLRKMKELPSLSSQSENAEPVVASNLSVDIPFHTYDRFGARDYALTHANNHNPNYFDYTNDGGDCTNFISQAIYEGGNASMSVQLPLPPPSGFPDYYTWNQWYYLNNLQRATAWTGVNELYDFVTSSFWDEGPVGYEVYNINELKLGDVIQYERYGDSDYDHAVIVVGFDEAGNPIVASHTPDFANKPYTFFSWRSIRFIHIERSNGYPPVKAQITSATDDAGNIPTSCGFALTNNEVYFGSCSNTGNLTSGFRFNNIEIPKGAQIKYAYLNFTVDGVYNQPINVQLYGEDSGNSVTFGTTTEDQPVNRTTFSNVVLWPISVTDVWNFGDIRTTPDLSTIIQNIIERPDWAYGNSLSIIAKNANSSNVHRRVISYERSLFEFPRSPTKLIAAYSLDTTTVTTPIVYSVVRESANPTNDASVNFTVTFSEPVTGVDGNDFNLTVTNLDGSPKNNYTAAIPTTGAVSGTGNVYTVTVNTNSDNDVKIRLNVNNSGTGIVDASSEQLNGGFYSGESYTIDKTLPTVLSAVRADPNPTSASTVNFTVTFSELVTGVDMSDFGIIPGGSALGSISAVSGSGKKYTITINTGVGEGTLRLVVLDDDTIVDYAGNIVEGAGVPNVNFSGEEYIVNKPPFVLSSLRASANPTNAASINFTVTFSEPVTGVNASDFSLVTSGISGAAVSGVSGSGSIYTVTVNTGSGSGTILLNVINDNSIKDIANNSLTAGFTSGETYTIDKIAPTVTSSIRVNPSPTNAASVNFTVTFSKPVTGVNATDFTLTTTGVSNAVVSGVTGSGGIYNVTVNTGSGSGTLRLNVINDNSIKDTANNPLAAGFTAGQTYTIDKTPPTISSSVYPGVNPTSAASLNFTVTFPESVTGVNASDFTLTTNRVSGAAVSGVSGSGSTYTITVNTGINNSNGTLSLNVVDDDSIKDAVNIPLGGAGLGNGNFSSALYTIIKSATFADVPLTYWANNYIERVYNDGVAGGCSTVPLNYCPDALVSRAQIAVFLLKGIHGSAYAPPAVGASTGFTDVPTNYWAAAWIKQLVAEGITGGCGAGNYCPDSPVTRAQVSIFLLKAKHGSAYAPPAVGASTGFTDVPTNYWAAAWIKQLVAESIASGCSTGNYCPENNVTRAEMAVFLVRTFLLP